MGVLDASNASVSFTAHKERAEILPGKWVELLAYHAERDGKTYLNPTIRVRKGRELSAEFTNDLDEETTVHWHGLHVETCTPRWKNLRSVLPCLANRGH
jgi:blue copper oxidase